MDPAGSGVRVAVALLVVLAGCSGVGANGEVTVTPAPVPEDAADVRPPLRGPTTGAALADRLAEALAAGSYTVRANESVRYANGSLHRRVSMEVRVAGDGTFAVALSVAGPAAPVLDRPPATARYWSDGEQYVGTIVRGDETVEIAAPRLEPYNFREGHRASTAYWVGIVLPGGQPDDDVRPLFDAVATEVDGRADRGDDRRFRLRSTGAVDRGRLADAEGVSDPRDVRLTALVDERGVLRRYELSYGATMDGEPVRVTRTVAYLALGSTHVAFPPDGGAVDANSTAADAGPATG